MKWRWMIVTTVVVVAAVLVLVLVGCGPTGVRTLAEVTDPDEIAEVLAAAESGRVGGSFTSILRRKITAGPIAGPNGGKEE